MTTAFIVLAVIVLAPVTSLILAVMLFGFPTEEEVLRSLASGAKTASDVTVETGKLLGGAWSALEELERQQLVNSYHSKGRRYWYLTRLGESDLRITGGRKKDV